MQKLLDMFARPWEWTPKELNAAQKEIEKRACSRIPGAIRHMPAPKSVPSSKPAQAALRPGALPIPIVHAPDKPVQVTPRLANKMAVAPMQQILDMFAKPADWTSEELQAAQEEIKHRGLRKWSNTFQSPTIAELNNALWNAAKGGDIAAVKDALSEGASPNATGPKRSTALTQTILEGHLQIIDTLLDAGADTNAKSDDGMFPLIVASLWGNTTVVQALIDLGADVNATNMDNMTALMYVACPRFLIHSL